MAAVEKSLRDEIPDPQLRMQEAYRQIYSDYSKDTKRVGSLYLMNTFGQELGEIARASGKDRNLMMKQLKQKYPYLDESIVNKTLSEII